VTTHQVKGIPEEMFDSVDVTEIAVDDLSGATDGADGVEGFQVGGDGVGRRGSVNEANGCAGLSKS